MLKGELAALAVAFCWTVSAVSFENASKRIGSLPVNILRLLIAYLLLTVYNVVVYGNILPAVDPVRGKWLLLSGFVGFFMGDLLLFRSFVLIGSRVAMLIMCSSPVMATTMGFLIFGERPSLSDAAAIIITLCGISLVVLTRSNEGKIKLAHSFRGILFAFGGAAGQAGGLALSKLGVAGFDPFIATQVRIIAGMAGFILTIVVLRRGKSVVSALKDIKGVSFTALGAVFGPFIGVSLSLYSVKYSNIGVASTIMSIVPVLLIPVSFLLYRESVRKMEIAGIIIAISGVSILLLK